MLGTWQRTDRPRPLLSWSLRLNGGDRQSTIKHDDGCEEVRKESNGCLLPVALALIFLQKTRISEAIWRNLLVLASGWAVLMQT